MKHTPAIIVPLIVLLVFLLPHASGFTDDGFIHVQYARNIIERGEYSFNPGEISFGTTSPLWVMELAALGTFFDDREALITLSRVFSWASGFAAIVVLYLLALALGARRWTATLASLTFACDAWFARWTALSMETSTAVLAVLLMTLASVRAFRDRRSAAYLGLTMVLASLLRPEVYLAFPVYLVSLWFQRRNLDRRCVWITAAVAAALIVPWLVFAKFYIGSFLPNTAGAKSGGLVLHPLALLRNFDPVVKIVGSTQALTVLAVVVAIVVHRSKSRMLSPPMRFLLLWVVALPLAYVVFDIQILSRYLLLVTPLVCVAGWIAIEELVENRFLWARARIVMAVVAAIIVAVNCTLYFKVILPPSRAFSHDLTHSLRDMAVHIRDNADEDAVVAAADIGYLAFYSNRRVLDLGGLVEPETGELRSRFSYEEIIQEGMFLGLKGYPRVDYFIDRDLEPARFEGRTMSGYQFRQVYTTVVGNLGLRKPGPYYYTLYQLTRNEL